MNPKPPAGLDWPVCNECGQVYPPDEPRSCDCYVGTAPLDESWSDDENEDREE